MHGWSEEGDGEKEEERGDMRWRGRRRERR